VALYRDEAGVLHRRSALCPHVGCIVEWNPMDKSFDCPCHGSQFDKYGRCINGPSTVDLEELAGGSAPTAGRRGRSRRAIEGRPGVCAVCGGGEGLWCSSVV
jgi:phenylpropionate dioxygenase-like ring-hydroxylating dioxygenase large terminal subunit